MAIKLEDFGEKIGGARKDMWSGRGLTSADIEEFNNLELDKYCNKKEVWKIDYKQLNEKYDLATCYYISLIYKKLPTSPIFSFNEPEEVIKRKCTEFIDTIHKLKEVILSCENMEEMKNQLELYLLDNQYLKRSERNVLQFEMTANSYRNPIMRSSDLLHLLLMKGFDPSYYHDKMKREAEIKNFLKPRDNNTLPRGYKVFKNRDGNYDVYKRQNGTVAIVSTLERTNNQPLKTEEEAIQWAIAWQKDSRAKIVRYVPPVLNTIERGGPKYRRTGRHSTGKMIMERFDFRAGEYGNWMTEADRQVSLNHAYDSLSDIARALNISYKDIGLNGNLAIAFASRGVKGAAAHYEPARKVINLTKLHGAGSLAHEWWHALDHYIASAIGVNTRRAAISSSKERYPAMNELVTTMQYHEGKPTHFYLVSKKQDENREAYWSKPEEMCARAFACYMHDKLGYRNDYLTGHAYLSPAIPHGEERERIFKKFDALFDDLVKDNILTKDEHLVEIENEKAAEEQLNKVNEAANEISKLTFEYESLEVEQGNQITFEDLFSIIKSEEPSSNKEVINDTSVTIDEPESEIEEPVIDEGIDI